MAATETDVQVLRNFIDGEHVDAAGGRTQAVINPATGETIAQAPDSGAEDVDRAVAAARAAFDGWSNTTPGERALALLRLADAIEEHGDELARAGGDQRRQAARGGQGRRDPGRSPTTCASSPAPRACSRARRRASTSRATRR